MAHYQPKSFIISLTMTILPLNSFRSTQCETWTCLADRVDILGGTKGGKQADTSVLKHNHETLEYHVVIIASHQSREIGSFFTAHVALYHGVPGHSG